MKFRLLTALSLIFLLAAQLSAQENHYRKADHGLQMVYKQITGISLKDAIDSLLIEEYGALPDSTLDKNGRSINQQVFENPGFSNPNIIHRSDGRIAVIEFPDIKVVPGKDGRHLVGIRIGFEGDVSQFEKLNIAFRRLSKNLLSLALPIEELPTLCLVEGVKYIIPQPRVELE
jgi:hypothetical protein